MKTFYILLWWLNLIKTCVSLNWHFWAHQQKIKSFMWVQKNIQMWLANFQFPQFYGPINFYVNDIPHRKNAQKPPRYNFCGIFLVICFSNSKIQYWNSIFSLLQHVCTLWLIFYAEYFIPLVIYYSSFFNSLWKHLYV